jgi:RNA polymerase sigma-70 factor, ECF subfamily
VTTEQIGDEELVLRFQRGDLSAFSELFRRHQPTVTRLVARMLGVGRSRQPETTELEDLVQDVFVQVYRSLGSFRGSAHLSTWIYRIAINAVLMHRRATRTRPTLVHSDSDAAHIAVDPGSGPDEELVHRKNVAALYRHLSRLSEKKRTVYILHEIQGLTPAEIAAVVDTNVLTVRTRLFYARRELLASFREDPYLSSLVRELERSESDQTTGLNRESSAASLLQPGRTVSNSATASSREKLS